GALCLLLLPRPLVSTLFPYTTLFRSEGGGEMLNSFGDDEPCVGVVAGDRVGDLDGPVEDGHGVAVAACEVAGEVGAHDAEADDRSEEHTSELQSRENLVCRLLLEKKK